MCGTQARISKKELVPTTQRILFGVVNSLCYVVSYRRTNLWQDSKRHGRNQNKWPGNCLEMT